MGLKAPELRHGLVSPGVEFKATVEASVASLGGDLVIFVVFLARVCAQCCCASGMALSLTEQLLQPRQAHLLSFSQRNPFFRVVFGRWCCL